MSNIEITNEDKENFKKLLEDMALSIKNEEKSSDKITEVDKNISKLSLKVENLSTKEEANDLLNEIQDELWVLKEYSEFKNILLSLEKKVDELKNKYSQSVKNKLTKLEEHIIDKNNLTKEQLLAKAKEWRTKASNNIGKWIVSKLEQRDDWIWRLAKKANS